MVSSINSGNIDGAFPIAGQDNDSQGFRDNFTNIKNNFTFAKSEIEALQTSGATLSGTNDFSGNIIQDAELQDNSLTVFAKGTTSGTITYDHTQGHVQTLTTAGNTTFAFTNYPATGKQGKILVVVTLVSNDHIITLPGSVTTPPDFVVSVDGAGTYWYEFVSNDGGTTYTLFDKTRSYGANTGNLNISSNIISTITTNTDINISPNGTGNINLNSPIILGQAAQALSGPGAINVTTQITNFTSTGTGDALTLADGTDGQVKTVVYIAEGAGGDTGILTPTNFGAGTSITFNAVGDTAKLLFTNSTWHILSTYGTTVA